MAKAAENSTTRTRKPRASRAATVNRTIEEASELALQKLRELGIEDQLQRDIEWCLGSYRADRNPVGLYEKTSIALDVFKDARSRKTKGVTAKFINDIEKVVSSRP